MKKAILVAGGAGYIGSHMTLMLLEHGYRAVVVDDLSAGYRDAVMDAEFVQAKIGDSEQMGRVILEHSIDLVMHFAAHIEVSESVTNPAKYYQNNVIETKALLDCMLAAGVKQFIFSSTAAIFGEPSYTPIDEEHPKRPINPYGQSKAMVEAMLNDYESAYGLQSVALRYFNAAGADPQIRLGERHNPETHLIPLVLQAASGRRDSISIFGNDYPTPDGTCIRDYIHIEDLCAAHMLAIENVLAKGKSDRFNLGCGGGHSIREVIESAKRVSKREITVVEGDRRKGDPAILVADSTRANKVLGWKPQYGLEDIIQHAWQWELKHFA